MGAVGGVMRAFGSDDVNVTSKVKNQGIQSQIDASLGDLGTLRGAQGTALDDYISRYLAGTKNAETQTGQEAGAIGQFYNGQMSNQLAALRGQRQTAVNNAADIATKQALKGVAGNSLAREGGGGSYAQRLAIGATAPIRAQAAVDNANQAREDLGYLTTNQVNLAGSRTALQDKLAGRSLVPLQQRQALYGQNLGLLGQVTNLDQANKFYGLEKEKNPWADAADSIDQGIMNAAAIYGSVGGGAGGMARGGPVDGPGDETSDSIRARLSDGEYVVPAAAVELPGVREFLDELRDMGLRRQKAKDMVKHFFRGGLVRHFSGGGLAESANYLGQRASADLFPDWQPATFVPVAGGPPPPPAPAPNNGIKPGPAGGGGGGGGPQQANREFMRGYDAYNNGNGGMGAFEDAYGTQYPENWTQLGEGFEGVSIPG